MLLRSTQCQAKNNSQLQKLVGTKKTLGWMLVYKVVGDAPQEFHKEVAPMISTNTATEN